VGRVATPGRSYDEFVEALRGARERIKAPSGVISVSLAGVIDSKTGLAQAANIPCINNRLIENDLSEQLRNRVVVHNDVSCFALAEAHHGVAKGHGIAFAVVLGTGVGGGIVVNGHLLNGSRGITGEWGHGSIVDPRLSGLADGMPDFECGCGRVNCVDTVCSARGMERIHAALHNENLSSEQIVAGWREGHANSARSVAVYTEHTARALSFMVNVIGADIVPVGGGLANVTDLIKHVDRRVRDLTLADFERPIVVPGIFRSEGGLVGAGIAAALMLEAA